MLLIFLPLSFYFSLILTYFIFIFLPLVVYDEATLYLTYRFHFVFIKYIFPSFFTNDYIVHIFDAKEFYRFLLSYTFTF